MTDLRNDDKKATPPRNDLYPLLVKELSVSRRHYAAYPADHPLIAESLKKTADLLSRAMAETGTLTIAGIRDRLRVGDDELDPKNLAFLDLARTLRGLGLAAITFLPGTEKRELLALLEILSLDPLELKNRGGAGAFSEKRELATIRFTDIDYSRLHVTEQDTVSGGTERDADRLWKNFVLQLLEGGKSGGGEAPGAGSSLRVRRDVLDRILGEPAMGADGKPAADKTESERPAVDVALLAKVLNTAPEGALAGLGMESRSDLIDRYVGELADEDTPENVRLEAMTRFSAFVERLDPALKNEFLQGLIRAFGEKTDIAKPFLSGISPDAIADALSGLQAKEDYVPPAIVSVLRKISGIAGAGSGAPAPTAPMGSDPQTQDESGGKIQTIFREEIPEDFVSSDYRASLDSFLLDEIPDEVTEEAKKLGELFSRSDPVERHVVRIIFESLQSNPEEEERKVLHENLDSLCQLFIETGDFRTLASIHESLAGRGAADDIETDETGTDVDRFQRTDFLREILNGLDFWGKEKYPEITVLIRRIGFAFVEPMLMKLADSPSMSVRRFLIDRLSEAGEPAIARLMPRLQDGRWYFVRNVILILRNIGNDAVAPKITPHLSHPHPRVRQEAVRALLTFGDAGVEETLLEELRSRDREVRLQAIQHSMHSRSGEVLKELLELLQRSSLVDYRYETKLAALNALAETGHPGALPSLERLLCSGNLLHGRLHRRLRIEAVKSLSRYPSEPVLETLERLPSSLGRGELGRQLAQTAAGIRKRGPRSDGTRRH